MANRFVDAFRRVNRPPPPESSIALRVAVAICVLIPLAAVATRDVIPASVTIGGAVGVPAGFWFSWWRREHEDWWVKLILTILLVVVFGGFVRSMLRIGVASISETQEPLAALFVWVQVLHSFDVKGRRDLSFSLAAAVAMIAIGGVVALGADYGLFVFTFVPAVAIALFISRRCELRDLADQGTRFAVPVASSTGAAAGAKQRSRRLYPAVRSAVALTMVIALLGIGIFTFMPRFRSGKTLNLPFSIKSQANLPSGGFRVENPGIKEGGGEGGGETSVNGGYFGFANNMDLSVRARPSDEVVMRVRTDRPAFWRGLVYNKYDGRRWIAEQDDLRRLDGDPPVNIPQTTGTIGSGRSTDELIQTFYIETEQPNLVFAAQYPSTVYFPATGLKLDSNGSLRTPVSVEAGTVYSVISKRPKVDLEMLQASGDIARTERTSADTMAAYLAVPESVPQRVRDLAHSITSGATTTFEKVQAIENWLGGNTEYTLDIPPLPEGADAVDQFLFVDKQGYCEQIATAETILLRLLGVPTRVVTGYTQGRRGVFSGVFEVRGTDAHAWTEVYFPEFGWIEMDPTTHVPRANENPSRFSEIARWAKDGIGKLPDWMRAPFRGIRELLGNAGTFVAGIAAVVLLTVIAVLAARRKKRRKSVPAEASWHARVLARLDEAASPLGLSRRESQTATEFTGSMRAGPLLGSPEAEVLKEVAESIDRDAFSSEPLPDELRLETDAAVDEIIRLLQEAVDQPV